MLSPTDTGPVRTAERCLSKRRRPEKPVAPWAGMFLWLISASAAAVGLGGMELTSAPGQPLEAEIPIDPITAQQFWRLQVGVAPEQTFARNGLDRAAELDDLRFEIVRDSAGRSVVRITSPDALTMPVTLLLEATWFRGPSWPRSRLVREYALEPQSATGGGAESPPAGAGALETYGPIRAGDTLWSLADRFRPSGVHTNQMMVAIFEANPRRFGGNMNGMYLGAALRIPEAVQALRLTVVEATEEAILHLEAWLSRSERPVQPGFPTAPVRTALAAEAVTYVESAAEADALQAELDEARRLLESRDQQLQALRTELMEAQAAAQAAEEAAARLAAAPPPPPPAQPSGLAGVWSGISRIVDRAIDTVIFIDLSRATHRALNIGVLIGAGVLAISGVVAGFVRGRRRRRRVDEDLPEQADRSVADADVGEPPPSDSKASAADSRATMDTASQLDLARSFVDMGDVESARKTLQGVIDAGDADQREQATAFLASIDARPEDHASDADDDKG